MSSDGAPSHDESPREVALLPSPVLGGSIAAALLLLGIGEAYVLVPAYPLLTAAAGPARSGLVSAVFNGCWAVGQGCGPLVLAVASWNTAMACSAVAAVAFAAVFLQRAAAHG
eukprot:TRINITY_DN27899_c0_g1_i1.p1 TRINITY_DN27899_c0_g1~~TRINITY_DN27899_c0_g1_i1.p1  ORF type:complete len:113 (-),score=23.71 TRINITY_DN27899_c0_g1_i1:76-414(-)